MKRLLAVFPCVAILAAATPEFIGGWAVVTVEDLPEVLVVGEPTTLAFTVRSHGREVRTDVSPSLRVTGANDGWLSRTFAADRIKTVRRAGSPIYEGVITPRDTGTIKITVNTDWNGWQVELLPLRVIAPGTLWEPQSPSARGLQLFVAKGCVTCHAKRDEPVLGANRLIQVGPDLTGRTFPEVWLAKKLASPAEVRGNTDADVMPALGLDDREIAALVSYLNQRQVVVGAGSMH